MPLHLEKLKNQKVDARAEKRKRLIESDAFVIPSGRTVEEIDKYIREMRAESSIFKEEEGGRRIMSEAVVKYAEKYAENVRLNSLLDSIKKMMTNLKIEAEQAMNVLEVNDSDREILQKRL